MWQNWVGCDRTELDFLAILRVLLGLLKMRTHPSEKVQVLSSVLPYFERHTRSARLGFMGKEVGCSEFNPPGWSWQYLVLPEHLQAVFISFSNQGNNRTLQKMLARKKHIGTVKQITLKARELQVDGLPRWAISPALHCYNIAPVH